MSNVPSNFRDGRWVRNKQLASYLNTSVMSLHRWKEDPTLNFPPAAIIRGIEYNDLDAIDAWMRSRMMDRATRHLATRRMAATA